MNFQIQMVLILELCTDCYVCWDEKRKHSGASYIKVLDVPTAWTVWACAWVMHVYNRCEAWKILVVNISVERQRASERERRWCISPKAYKRVRLRRFGILLLIFHKEVANNIRRKDLELTVGNISKKHQRINLSGLNHCGLMNWNYNFWLFL